MKASELVQAMIDAGAPIEAALIALRAIEERDATIDAKRSVERDRKRRQRAKNTDDGQNCDGTVTGQSRDITGTVPDAPSPSLPPNEYISNPPTHPHPDNKTRARKGTGTPAKPEDVSAQVWGDFLTHRRAKHAPVSETVVDGHRREAAKAGITLEAALAECVTSGWQAFKAHYLTDRDKHSGRPAANDPADFLSHLTAKRGGP